MSDSKNIKPGREGTSLYAKLLRHKDQVLEGLVLDQLLKLKPSGAAPTWDAFLKAAAACHKSMDHLRDNPDDQAAYDESVRTTDTYAAAARVWAAVAAAQTGATPAAGEAQGDANDADE